ncbi:hypothetical protein [Sulfitobacter sp. BSw21498]|uniref:hypothetical protein n=1 Tax=Sulfitobacter sp. BSw21498 TaxID=664426 RepID=UPI001110BE5D|nr:hypothetical protein [Sulfitobacter sp. BSw21498]
MTAALKSRLARLEAKHKSAADKPKGVIGGRFNGSFIEEVDGVLYLRREEPPGGFAEYARNQQNALQAELRTIFADMNEPQPEGIPAIVGNEPLAPLPKNKKRARYIEINGVELDALALRGNRR